MRPSLFQFVAQSDADELTRRLERAGYLVRRLDGRDIESAADLWAASARQLGHPEAKGWDGYADYLWQAILPDDDEGEGVAVVWEHADELAEHDMNAFALALDTLATIGRGANGQGLEVVTFFLGDGPGYRPLESLAALAED
jgi:hypothetical protein